MKVTECPLCCLRPGYTVWQGFSGQIIQGAGQSAEAGDKSLVVPYQNQERFHLFLGGGAGPVPDGGDLVLLVSDNPPSDLVTQV